MHLVRKEGKGDGHCWAAALLPTVARPTCLVAACHTAVARCVQEILAEWREPSPCNCRPACGCSRTC